MVNNNDWIVSGEQFVLCSSLWNDECNETGVVKNYDAAIVLPERDKKEYFLLKLSWLSGFERDDCLH